MNDYYIKREEDPSWDWLTKTDKVPFELVKGQELPVILKDYLLFLKKRKNDKSYTNEWNRWNDLLDKHVKFKGAVEDLTAMKEQGIGGYKFKPPPADGCKHNLFRSREFINDEVKDRADDQIRVMHWNILADGLAGTGLLLEGYKKSLEKQFASPKECLEWKYRKWLILEEIAHYDPDIITLVELDKSHAQTNEGKAESLQYWLENLGYDLSYKWRESGVAFHGTGFFWKTKILKREYETIWADLEGGQIFGLIRFSLQHSKAKPAAKLAVCALHLDSKKNTGGEKIRANQIWNALNWLNYKVELVELETTWKGMGMKDKKEKVPTAWPLV
eukprot:TRINITY_DN324_c0_g1_i1.p1 TRINITY_DN324_c0_g1~~TRINITY_DN324_c0_g1_i1.p1  ORF type:complete len:331 (+),score=65.32 TRINITY_DN324_c0_g1_i1:304-1296(+)